MKLEVWSDFACPYCYIGIYNFYLALDTYNEEMNQHEYLCFKTYQLSPEAPVDNVISYHEMLAQKYDVPLDRGIEMTTNTTKIANEAGLTLNFDSIIVTNTDKAHKLTSWTQINQPQYARKLVMTLFKAYFTDGENISDISVLQKIIEKTGIQDINLDTIIKDDKTAQKNTLDQAEAMKYRIQSVPFFVFDRKDAISGAQTPVNFYQVLKQIEKPVINEENQ